VTIIEQGNMAT